MLAVAFGAVAERVSGADVMSGSVKVVDDVLRAPFAGVPSVVPFGP